ncbi:MAG: hypothetical protein ABUS79_03690 [Pseudomonadota bacterium]
MSALAAARTNVSNKGKLIQTIGYKCKASTTFYSGALVAVDTTGYLVPATTTAGHRVVGWVELSNAISFVSAAVDGTDSLEVRTGIVPMFMGTSTDLPTIADVGRKVYALDDQTVSRLPGAGRPVAGELVKIEGSLAYIGIGFYTPNFAADDSGSGGSAYQGDGTVAATAAPGAISVATAITTLAVDGTDAYTLADGLFLGQRKTCVVISGANTPVGTITPATPSGFATVTALGAVGDSVEFIWGGAGAWYIASSFGCTFT